MDLIFPNFFKMHPDLNYGEVGKLDLQLNDEYGFVNNDETLRGTCQSVVANRIRLGLEGLVGDLQCIIINVEKNNLEAAAEEFLKNTNYIVSEHYENLEHDTIVLKYTGSCDILLRARNQDINPFININIHPKSKSLPNTRLETLVFETFDIKSYFNIQKERGVQFLTESIVSTKNYDFIQTIPSHFTGNSIGVLQWKNERGFYTDLKDTPAAHKLTKPAGSYLKNIGVLDHAATRLKAIDRDAALIEFMELTNYTFDFAIYVDALNSITNVARLENGVFAAVFTSGISPYLNDRVSGPTEKFTNNYGARVHHLAFNTEEIDVTVTDLKNSGMRFISDLVGSPKEGLKQIFSAPSPTTFLVNEYIHRFGEFHGFFTKSNVALLTQATENQ